MKKIITLSLAGLLMLLSCAKASAMEGLDFDSMYARIAQMVLNEHDGEWCPSCMSELYELYQDFRPAKVKNVQLDDDARYARELYEKEKEEDTKQRETDEKLAQELHKQLNPNHQNLAQDEDDEGENCFVCFDGPDMITRCCKQNICRACWDRCIADKKICPHCQKDVVQ